ncbi:putative phosphoglucan, water dikinase [Gregarina niphandrodes]|uniref:Phosphoglucan, water dikinase n=1 Tax=Gregarina niphandrodes TaxID=110365 RepID=A0A023BAH3_GRENI|nr:putative phosphoglucan, water dikinase [Gregarina niphandrodes]EZG78247.1 putative phosphoglucan, water dikinase [Gregarina niphandrodes]|eukprot:XP_011129379.1 putative phosphoglucan, water dikinase [Gregarina niphandrodes]
MPAVTIPPPVVVFECRCEQTVVGQQVYVIGSCEELGCWGIDLAVPLSTSSQQFPRWLSCAFELQTVDPGTSIEFKFLIKNADGSLVLWESGANRSFRCPDAGHLARVKGVFDRCPTVNISITVASATGATAAVATPEPGSGATTTTPPAPAAMAGCARKVPYLPPQDVLTALAEYRTQSVVELISTTHGNTKSLRERLEFIANVVTSRPASAVEMLRTLALLSLYWEWVATRVLFCGEDGRHFRPNHVAQSSKEIFDALVAYLDPAGKGDAHKGDTHSWALDVTEMVARRLMKLLPSFDAKFTATVPMTRIRDIAHRNDIPSDVKTEIKTTLQNKLHRCASPQDLVTCRSLLDKYRAQNLNPDFLSEFTAFESELTQFFNQQSYRERLDAVRDVLNSNAVDTFLKKIAESAFESCEAVYGYNAEGVLTKLMNALAAGVALRSQLYAVKDAQQVRVADVETEDTLTQLLCRTANVVEEKAPCLASDVLARTLVRVLRICLDSMALSGVVRPLSLLLSEECGTILECSEPMLNLACESLGQRVARICTTFSELVSATYDSESTQTLARNLGVQTATSALVAESFIRESFLFQVSRVASVLCATTQTTQHTVVCAGSEPNVRGRLVSCKGFEEAAPLLSSGDVGVIVAVEHLTGDEDVTTYPGLAGIVAKHEVPLLSHIGVRARQRRLPFVCIVSPTFNWSAFVQKFENSNIVFTPEAATGALVTKAESAATSPAPASKPAPPGRAVVLPLDAEAPCLSESSSNAGSPKFRRRRTRVCKGPGPTRFASALTVLAGKDIRAESCGSKAAVCAQLHELLEGTHLKAPPCLALPFGSIDAAFRSAVNQDAFSRYDALRKRLTSSSDAELPELCASTQRLVMDLALSREVVVKFRDAVALAFLANDVALLESQRLALYVRSSSSVEDNSEDAAAGVYESVTTTVTWSLPSGTTAAAVGTGAGLPANGTGAGHTAPGQATSGHAAFVATLHITELWLAVKQVWASLYAVRAVRARRGHEDAGDMGVLIQPVVNADWSFYAYTRAPASLHRAPGCCYIELVKGLGESLAGGGRSVGGGRGFRLLVSPQTKMVDLCGVWSMWGAVQADITPCFDALTEEELRPDYWKNLGIRLADIHLLETLLQRPQDVEGCVVNGRDLFIVQSRPQTD